MIPGPFEQVAWPLIYVMSTLFCVHIALGVSGMVAAVVRHRRGASS